MMDLTEIIKNYKNSDANKKLKITSIRSPVGNVIAAADEQYLYLVSFEDSKNLNKKINSLYEELTCSFKENDKNPILETLKNELDLYFKGKLKKFTVSLRTFGSDFQKEVWSKLLELPYASTQTYGEFATAMGRPGCARAVGAACGANAHLLLIPCHRLVASGSKGGYNSGVDRKEMLLQVEKKYS